jgi:hypothetical protein
MIFGKDRRRASLSRLLSRAGTRRNSAEITSISEARRLARARSETSRADSGGNLPKRLWHPRSGLHRRNLWRPGLGRRARCHRRAAPRSHSRLRFDQHSLDQDGLHHRSIRRTAFGRPKGCGGRDRELASRRRRPAMATVIAIGISRAQAQPISPCHRACVRDRFVVRVHSCKSTCGRARSVKDGCVEGYDLGAITVGARAPATIPGCSLHHEKAWPSVRPRARLFEFVGERQQSSLRARTGGEVASDRQALGIPVQRH